MAASHHTSEGIARGARMLRTALGPAIARFLEDPGVVEVTLNPDGRLWIDRLSEGLSDTGERLAPKAPRPPWRRQRPSSPPARPGSAPLQRPRRDPRFPTRLSSP